jgi:hypothetical protein
MNLMNEKLNKSSIPTAEGQLWELMNRHVWTFILDDVGGKRLRCLLLSRLWLFDKGYQIVN